LGITVVRGPDHSTQSTFIFSRLYHGGERATFIFGHHGGERARPLNIYFFEVVIILGHHGGERTRPLYIYFFEVVIILGHHGGETARPLYIYFFEVVIILGHHGGERARTLYIYFFEVVIILGVTVVRGPDPFTFIFLRLYLFWASRIRKQQQNVNDESIAHNFSKTIHFF
jgi:hypothetical protein